MCLLVALGSEFFRSLVAEGAVRPNHVIFAPKPSRLCSGIRHRFKFLSLQKSSRNRLWNDSMSPFSQGHPGATGSGSVPCCGHQSDRAAQTNSLPLSLRIRAGAPRRPITRASIRRTSGPVSAAAAWSTKHSLVDSSTTDNHLSDCPPAVRSMMKSHVHTSFACRAGCCVQLFALAPGFVPSFRGDLRRGGRRSPNARQSRRTRLMFTVQPSFTRRA